MKIAIFGANSQMAKNLITAFLQHDNHELILYGRNPKIITDWLSVNGYSKNANVSSYDQFINSRDFDLILNFVGVGDPAKAVEMGQSIFEVTYEFDNLAIRYLIKNPDCKYIFLSSGAVYGSNFENPVNSESKAIFSINNIQPHDWYAIAKLHAECKHRALPNLSILDLRVFNYFSHTQSLDARFLLTDILRSIKERNIFKTSSDNIVRDFLSPSDFYQLVKLVMGSPKINLALDCYSKLPIDKMNLLEEMKKNFGLQYEICDQISTVNATGIKQYYFSENKIAKKIGYEPKLTSLESICIEVPKLLELHGIHF